jgi:hypothetical protein
VTEGEECGLSLRGRTVRLARKKVRRSLRHGMRESLHGRESDSVDWVPL